MQRVVLPIYCSCKFVDRSQDNLRSEGLGDTIAKITTAIGIKPCGSCKERQARLNAAVPYEVPGPKASSSNASLPDSPDSKRARQPE
jgi:hypothetical protein